jgi:hypothetical protein
LVSENRTSQLRRMLDSLNPSMAAGSDWTGKALSGAKDDVWISAELLWHQLMRHVATRECTCAHEVIPPITK